VLRQDDFVKGQLVLLGWRYGHQFGGHLGSCVIMSCLANRQKLGWGSWIDVISNVDKYSATLEQPKDWPSIWEPQFVRLLHECESIHDGSQDYAKGAVYWFDSAKPVDNPWFKEKILDHLEVHPKVGDMNSLIFLR
jgi:antibiotic biosynthesis monooxygenase (ABM) superfamily enzyme